MTRWRALALGTVAALLLLPAAVAAQQSEPTAVVEAARQVTTDSSPVRLFTNPQLAVHPDSPSTVVVAVGDARNGGCGLRVTRDGGMSWATTTANFLPDGVQHCIHRSFGSYITPVFASDGTLYVGFSGSAAEDHPNGPLTAYVARSDDLGETIETFTVAESGEASYTSEDGEEFEGFERHRYNSFAVDPTDPDRVYSGWRMEIGGVDAPFGTIPVRSFVATSADGGETWSDPVDLTATLEDVFGSDIPQLVVGPDGAAYAFAKERPPRAAEGEERPTSRIFMWRSTDGGQSWSGEVINEGAASLDNPAAAIDTASGDLYVTYSSRGNEEDGISSVFALSSSDSGETWSDPAAIGDEGQASSYNKYFPGVSVAPNGRVDVAWHDFRNDPFFVPGEVGGMGTAEGERYWDVYMASSSDGGSSWTPNVRVSDRSIDGKVGVTFNNNDFRGPIGVRGTDSDVYVTWADSRAGDLDFEAEDAYFTRVRLEGAAAGTTAAATGDDDRVLWSLVGAAAALAVGGLVLVIGTRMARRSHPATAHSRARSGTDE